MTNLWVPDRAALDLQEQRAALVRSQVDTHREYFAHWNKLLKEIDPYLQLVRASDDATAPELRPSYWHVVRHIPGSAPSVIVHEGPNGEYLDPDSSLLERLRRGDMWNDRAQREREKLAKKAERAQQREEEREAEDRVAEITERLLSLKNTQIRVPKALPDKEAS